MGTILVMDHYVMFAFIKWKVDAKGKPRNGVCAAFYWSITLPLFRPHTCQLCMPQAEEKWFQKPLHFCLPNNNYIKQKIDMNSCI